MRIALRTTVLIAWAVVMAALVQRTHRSLDVLPAPSSPLPREASEEWQGIYSGEKKIGYAVTRRAPTAAGFTIENDALVRLTMLGEPRVIRTHVTADTDPNLRLNAFGFRLRSGPVEFTARGNVKGETLDVSLDSGGGRTRSFAVPLSGPIVLPQTLPTLLARETIEPGRTFRYSLFDPLSGEPAPIVLTVGAEETIEIGGKRQPALLVTEEFRGSRFRLWVDREGRLLREEGPLGLVLVPESRDSAAEGLEGDGALDIVAASAIPVSRAISSPRETRGLTLRLQGVPADRSFAFPPRQEVSGELLRIQREDLAALSSFTLPSHDARFTKEIEPTPFLQSDDPRITKLARTILRDEIDARRAAEKLLRWVFDNLEKVPTVSVPDALEVLSSRRGDCNEHAVLYAALARAAGLPARVVAGAVYMADESGGAGAFAYHAWNEVWLGEWTAADPTFGQLPADATHLKLIEGGPETHAGLLGLIGRVRIEIEDVR